MSALLQFTTDFGQPTPAVPEVPKESVFALEEPPRKQPRPAFRVVSGTFGQWLGEPAMKGLEFGVGKTFEAVHTLGTTVQNVEEIRRTLALTALDAIYVIDNRRAVTRFIQANRLFGLLLEARKPLSEAFGDVTKTLSLITDDEGFETLFCLVMTPAALGDARTALAVFDNWWVDRSGQVVGKLNFDFELI